MSFVSEINYKPLSSLVPFHQSTHMVKALCGPVGSGKCLQVGTPIILYDGTVKPVEAVQVGDQLMGPDSRPRTVLSTTTGTAPLYRVTPVKGDPYTVNGDHVLSLWLSATGKSRHGDKWRHRSPYYQPERYVEVSVETYLGWSSSKKRNTHGWRTGVEWGGRAVPIDPYFFGVWLGDGYAGAAAITTADPEIVQEVYDQALAALGVLNNKHVPDLYRTNSRAVRLQVLAGLIDTDGYVSRGGCDIIQKRQRLADDILWLARSVGFAAYKAPSFKRATNSSTDAGDIYWRVSISGDLSCIPTRLPRKRAGVRLQKKNVLRTGITVEPVGAGQYAGFVLDGDGLFLLGDFTVTHNSSAVAWEWLMLCLESTVPVRGIVIRENYRQLRDTTLTTIQDWFRDITEWKERDETLLFHLPGKNKKPLVHQLMFRACRKPEEASKFLSTEPAFIWLEEPVPAFAADGIMGAGLQKGVFDIALTRLRQKDAPRYLMVLSFNPPSTQHWTYKEFFLKSQEELDKKGYALFRQPAFENSPNLPPGYYQRLEELLSPDLARRFIRGETVSVYAGERVFPEAVDGFHIVDDVAPIPGVPLVGGSDWGRCYDDKTEVLTDDGWKLFTALDGEERFATLNTDTKQVEWHYAYTRVAFRHIGPMLHWQRPSLDICVTPEHNMVWADDHDPSHTIRRTSAETLAEKGGYHQAIPVSAVPQVGEDRGIYGPLGWDAVVFARFMGWWLSAGRVDAQRNRITISQKTEDAHLAATLVDTGLRWTWSGRSYQVSDAALAAYLRSFGSAADRFIPAGIKALPPAYLQEFVLAYTHGDGHHHRPTRSHIYSCSSRMADDLQEVALRLGWAATKQRAAQSGITNTGGWRVSMRKTAHWLRPGKPRIVSYDGYIYCVGVPNHTLYVRRNGRPCWSGNTPCALIAQVSPLGQLRVMREVQLWDASADRLAEELRQELNQRWFGYTMPYLWSDPSGNAKGQANEASCFEVFSKFDFTCKPGAIPVNVRLECTKQRLERTVSGEPAVLISRSGCPLLSEALLGGYRYPKSTDGRVSAHPLKNEFSHIADSLMSIMTGEFPLRGGEAMFNVRERRLPKFYPLTTPRRPRRAPSWATK